jgi:hypothetical protein
MEWRGLGMQNAECKMQNARRLALMTLTIVTIAASAQAQGAWQWTPILTASQMYDTNLMSTAARPESDFVTHLSAGVESIYRTPKIALTARGTSDVERFVDHPQLTRADARQRGSLLLSYRRTPRLVFTADVDFLRTQSPNELLEESGLMLSRARAQRITVHSAMTREIDTLTTGTIAYSHAQDRFAAGVGTSNDAVTLAGKRRMSPRQTATAAYELRQATFGGHIATSHVLSAGWTRVLTPAVTVSATAGPEIANGALGPHATASFDYHAHGTDVSAAYARTKTTVLGLPTLVDVQSVTTSAAWTSRTRAQLRIGPGLYRSEASGLTATVYRFALEAGRPVTREWFLRVSSASTLQHGDLYRHLPGETIPRHTLTISLEATPAVGVR